MEDVTKVPKEQLLKLTRELEKEPSDKIRILGDAGITLVGAGLGVAAAGTLATIAGASSIVGLTTAASWVGLTVIGATPVGWVICSAAAAGAAVYGVSRLIRGGGLAEGRKAELLQTYREEARRVEAKERAGSIQAEDRTQFILSLRELIDTNAIPPMNAFRLIEQIEQGRITLSQGFALIQGLLLDIPDIAPSASTENGQTINHGDKEDAVASGHEQQNNEIGSRTRAYFDSINTSIKDAGTSLKANSEPITAYVTSTASAVSAETKKRFSGIFQQPKTSTEEAEPQVDPPPLDAERLAKIARDAAPVIWMLGKTGAGKTSVIATLTDSPHAEIGNGYVSCTLTARLFDFPQEAPLLRFLDTRGLGEAGYDPTDDLAWHEAQSHLVLVVMKVSDPSQERVLEVLKTIRQKHTDWPVLVVQTGLHELYSPDSCDHPSIYPFKGAGDELQDPSIPRKLRNALAYQREMFSALKGVPPVFVPVDFTLASDGFQPPNYGKPALIDGVLKVAPEAVRLLVRLKLQQDDSGISDQRARTLNMRILYWAAGAAAVGAAPVVGLVTVPAAQAAMLVQLAKEYGVEWGVKDLSALLGMLGIAIVANQGALFALRQLSKLGPWMIPVAAAQDYAVTYALGRAACIYLQARKSNTNADAELVKNAFLDGLRQAFSASGARKQ